MLTFTTFYLRETGRAPSVDVLLEEFGDAVLERVGGDDTSTVTEIEYLIDRFKSRYIEIKREAIVRDIASKRDPNEFVEALAAHNREMFLASTSGDYIVSQDTHKLETAYLIDQMAQGFRQGITYGFPQLDLHTGGSKRNHLTFLVASPKRFKTFIALNAFIEQRRAGEIPVFHTLELSKAEIWSRALCMLSGVSFTKFDRGQLMKADWKKIEQAEEEFSALGPFYIVEPAYDKRKVSDLLLEAQKVDATTIIVDQLNYIQSAGNYFKENEKYREIVQEMKLSAGRHNIPWMCLGQFTREASSLEEMATPDMIGLTRAITETSDLVLGLHRNEEMKEDSIVQIGVMEGRHCESGRSARWNIKVDLWNQTSFRIEG
jgi:replicative DNA helicase